MEQFAGNSWFADVKYKGYARLIACGVLETHEGLLLVDPGPAVSLGTLKQALASNGAGLKDVHGVLLTHIHLDHAGATGTIVSECPHVLVYVHEQGAPHMVNPEKLLASVRRIYGDAIDASFGPFLSVPEQNIRVLTGADALRVGERSFKIAYTPGHANHHVCYLDASTGTAFAGDVAGMRVAGLSHIVPVALPPDINIEKWQESMDVLRAWSPQRLFLTHFGTLDDVEHHLEACEHRLLEWAEEVRRSLAVDADDAERAKAFHATEMAAMCAVLQGEDRVPYEQMGQPKESWYGLARYWRTRQKG